MNVTEAELKLETVKRIQAEADKILSKEEWVAMTAELISDQIIYLLDAYTTPGAVGFLYKLLGERTAKQSISHRLMPTFDEHEAFVASQPYHAWYVIEDWRSRIFIGAIYLTNKREVGLFLLRNWQGEGYGSAALHQLSAMHPGPLLANVSPHNEASQEFFLRHKFKPIQITYERQ